MSELETEFQKAAKDVQALPQKPSNDDLLQLYAYYKQSTEGEVKGGRPGLLDLKGRAKFDAWSRLKGTSKEIAMKEYVALVQTLQKRG